MNDILQLKERVLARFPEASLSLDKPDNPDASWWLDIQLDGQVLIVEWRPGKGFGLSSQDRDDYGMGADEVYGDLDSAFGRVRELLLSRLKTMPPPHVRLAQLREMQSLSQVELAGKLRISQAALSKMERRYDLMVGTLRKFVEAMGGKLELRAVYPDGTFRILLEEEAPKEPGPPPLGAYVSGPRYPALGLQGYPAVGVGPATGWGPLLPRWLGAGGWQPVPGQVWQSTY